MRKTEFRRLLRPYRRGRLVIPMVALLLGVAAAACTYRGGIDNPLVQRASWFSYLDGTDIRRSCVPGGLDRYRLVYNGRYHEQLRSYEVVDDGAGGAYLVARARSQRDGLMGLSSADPFGPWRWQKSDERLTPEAFAEFRRRLADSGFGAGAPVGLRLYSEEFYWVASGCANGVFHFDAWSHPSPRYAALRFPEFLFAHDRTGLAVNPPRPLTAEGRFQERGQTGGRDEATRFVLQVTENGLGGASGLF